MAAVPVDPFASPLVTVKVPLYQEDAGNVGLVSPSTTAATIAGFDFDVIKVVTVAIKTETQLLVSSNFDLLNSSLKDLSKTQDPLSFA